MNEKVCHLCGLAVKYLIHINTILGDKQIDRYIKKLQKINQKLLKQSDLVDVCELQYDVHCGLKQLYKMMRQAGLLDAQNKPLSDLLVQHDQVYFSPAGHRCCVHKIGFVNRNRQKILNIIKSVNKVYLTKGETAMDIKELNERWGDYAKSLEYLYDKVFPMDEVYKMFNAFVPQGEDAQQWINRLVSRLPAKYIKDGGVTGRGLGEMRNML